MAVTAPTGNVYVFDPAKFLITGATGDCNLTFSGLGLTPISVRLSTYYSTINYDCHLLLKSLFTNEYIAINGPSRPIGWRFYQAGVSVANGSFTAIYGTNLFTKISSFTLRWLGRNGTMLQDTFCLYEEVLSREDVQTVKAEGLDQLVDFEKVRTFEIYIPNLDVDKFRDYTSIQETGYVRLLLNDTWIFVSVKSVEYVINRASGLMDFHVIITMPYYD